MRADLIRHILANIILINILSFGFFRDKKLCCLIAFFIGISLELTQLIFDLGHFELADILANCGGILIGILLTGVIKK